MDPISALIGAGSSLIGGFLNRSSTQSINAANLQQQMQMAQGAYLPGLVANANAAGLNPLAVLGQHAPAGGSAVPIGGGEGIADAGKFLSQIKDPHTVAMEKEAEQKVKTETELLRAQMSNVSIEAARNLHVLKTLITNPRLLPTGVQEPASDTGFGLPQIKSGQEWLKEHPFPSLDSVTKKFDLGSWSPGRPQVETGAGSNLGGYLDWIFQRGAQ